MGNTRFETKERKKLDFRVGFIFINVIFTMAKYLKIFKNEYIWIFQYLASCLPVDNFESLVVCGSEERKAVRDEVNSEGNLRSWKKEEKNTIDLKSYS